MKLMMTKKIMTQENGLAKEIYVEQMKNNWHGLVTEVKEICEEMGINNINEKEVNNDKKEEAIYCHNYNAMRIEVNS